jgi:hypothetical protein
LFDISTGVCQGDPLSTTSFNLVLDSVIKKLDLRGDINSNGLRAEAEFVGLYINEDKTKYMHLKRTDQRNIPLHIKKMYFKKVCNFTYLPSVLNESNLMQPEISERICKGNRAYYANAKLLRSKLLKRSTKMKMYLTLTRPVLTYASTNMIKIGPIGLYAKG